MIDKFEVINSIQFAFCKNVYPGDEYLLGSTDGSEPLEEIKPFIGQNDWCLIPPEVLDTHSGALIFFSESGL
jgi:hypothetical protein